jgi:hypothetical protein
MRLAKASRWVGVIVARVFNWTAIRLGGLRDVPFGLECLDPLFQMNIQVDKSVLKGAIENSLRKVVAEERNPLCRTTFRHPR